MSKTLKVLFVPVTGAECYACIGVAEGLIAAGHTVLFAIDSMWAGRFVQYGIQEVLLEVPAGPHTGPHAGAQDAKAAKVGRLQHLMKTGKIGPLPPIEKIQHGRSGIGGWVMMAMKFDKQVEPLLTSIKPDCIVLEQFLTLPSVALSGIPYVWLWSPNPLCMVNDDRAPPMCSGLSVNGDKKLWQEFRDVWNNECKESWIKFNDYVVSRGCQPLKDNQFTDPTKCLNIYGYPLELDYTDIRPLPKNFIRFDNFKRFDQHLKFEIPVPLRDRPGKLVYFSLSTGGSDVKNMKRLVTILSKSKHRFIVSKGPLHEEYDLPVNMWGAATVPQIQVLQLVDLVITHGGNNTTTETMYFGKPMIVLPLYGDQYDNAQQVQDKGFGIRLDAYLCSEDELLNAIEKLLNDKPLNEKLRKISSRIQSDNSIAKVSGIIESYTQNPNNFL